MAEDRGRSALSGQQKVATLITHPHVNYTLSFIYTSFQPIGC